MGERPRRRGRRRAGSTLEGVGKTDADLLAVVDEAVAGTPLRWVAVESADELARLAELHLLRRDDAGRDLDLPCCSGSTPTCSPETAPGLAVGLAASKFGLSAADLEDLAAAPSGRAGSGCSGSTCTWAPTCATSSSWALAGCRAVEPAGPRP